MWALKFFFSQVLQMKRVLIRARLFINIILYVTKFQETIHLYYSHLFISEGIYYYEDQVGNGTLNIGNTAGIFATYPYLWTTTLGGFVDQVSCQLAMLQLLGE